ncbi:MAG: GAF domain-containing protein [Anaerolineae bacterium]|nr:GAF domain-containing protein [Anaerolineae bacterium]
MIDAEFSLPQMPTVTDADLVQTDPRLVNALHSLNRIGAAINRLTPQGYASVDVTLRLIAESVIQVVPGATAVLYTYAASEQAFEPASRVSAGESEDMPHDLPRLTGFGMRAIRQQRRVLSYEEADIDLSPAAAETGAMALACFPLIVASDPVGVLYVYQLRAARFEQFELLLLDSLVNHAAMAIYQAHRLSHIRQDLLRSEDALDRLRHAGMLISSRLGLDETLEAILDMALSVTGAQYGIFRLVDETGTQLVVRAVVGAAGRPQLGALPMDSSSVMGWVATHRQSLCIHDLEAAPWVRLYHPLDEDLRMRSELAVPLIGSSGRLEGVLNLESPMVGAFGDQDRHLLHFLATQAVIAIQEARLLDALLEVARLLLIEPYPRLLQHLVVQATNLLNASAGAIWRLDDDETLTLQATTEGPQRGDRLPLRGSLTGRAVIERAPVVSQDVRQDERFYRVDLARQQAWARALVVPIVSSEDGEPIGALSVYGLHGEPGHFTESEWDKKVLTCLAYYAALAFQNADRQRALRLAQERHAVAETFAAVGDVAANVLHHLNNKVGTIPVRVQGIEAKCGPLLEESDYLASNLREIERSAREAMDAVRDSLVNLRPIHPSPVTVVGCVRAALDEAQLPESVMVTLAALDDLPAVVASQRSLTFVFTNLLNNAATAMQGRGQIVIQGQALDAWVEIAVVDDGPGIARHLQERIFEFGLPTRTSRPNGKLGFGLWWVKTLMMRLGGSISVDSDGHQGTRFVLRLPRVEASDGSA